MTEQERNLGRRWFEEVWNQARREAIAELLAPDGVLHEGGTDTVGPDGFYPFFDRLRATLPDLRVKVDDCFGEGDLICVRWSATGKHTGEGLGIPPAGAAISVTGISVMRVKNGKLIEGWQNWDMLGMLQQIQGSQPAATYIGAPSVSQADGAAV
jgi:steroid delta-isomerase-like uncharacterized protein